jgi:hypothetical protein
MLWRCTGSECIDPGFLGLGTRWRRVMSFTPGERGPRTHWIAGWLGPRTGLDDVEKWKLLTLSWLELWLLGRSVHNQKEQFRTNCSHAKENINKELLLHHNFVNSPTLGISDIYAVSEAAYIQSLRLQYTSADNIAHNRCTGIINQQ